MSIDFQGGSKEQKKRGENKRNEPRVCVCVCVCVCVLERVRRDTHCKITERENVCVWEIERKKQRARAIGLLSFSSKRVINSSFTLQESSLFAIRQDSPGTAGSRQSRLASCFFSRDLYADDHRGFEFSLKVSQPQWILSFKDAGAMSKEQVQLWINIIPCF